MHEESFTQPVFETVDHREASRKEMMEVEGGEVGHDRNNPTWDWDNALYYGYGNCTDPVHLFPK